jgi:tripartite-type tricarboxylate transporter receptor subunit TctC
MRGIYYAAILITGSAAGANAAESPSAFYANKQITLTVGTSGGGSYDLYGRTLAQFLPDHIPGRPSIIVRNVPGSSGLALANSTFNTAPKDGTFIAISPAGMILSEVLEPETLAFKARQFGWVGTMSTMTDVLAVFKKTGIEKIEDVKNRPTMIGAGNKVGNPSIYAAVSNAILGTKFRIVLGYPGGTEMNLAMEQGELEGRTNQWDSWKTQRPQWIREGKLSYLLQFGPKVDELAGVPAIDDFAKSPDDRAVVDLLNVGELVGRSIYAPPGVPVERMAILRTAFDDTMRDPRYIARMKELGLDMLARKGGDLQADIERAMANTEHVAVILRKIIQAQFP